MEDNVKKEAEVKEEKQELSSDEKMMGMLSHLLGLLTGFLGPLIIYLIKKDESEFVCDQAKEALNFQIIVTIAYFISGALAAVLIGFLFIPIILICDIIFCIQGALKANDGIKYSYPMNMKIIK